jgi:hypothetical protein
MLMHLSANAFVPPQALNERKVEIRVQYRPPVQTEGATVCLEHFRNELVMRCVVSGAAAGLQCESAAQDCVAGFSAWLLGSTRAAARSGAQLGMRATKHVDMRYYCNGP